MSVAIRLFVCLVAVGASVLCAQDIPASPSVKHTDGNYVLSGQEISVCISADRGTVSRITSLRPTPLDVLPNTPDGLALTVRDLGTGKSYIFNHVISAKTAVSNSAAEVRCCLRPDDAAMVGIIKAEVVYRMYPDRFRILVTVDPIQGAEGPFEFVLGQKNARVDYWMRQSFPGVFGNMDVLSAELMEQAKQQVAPISVQVYQRFNDHPNDATIVPSGIDLKQCRFPYGILEGRDRFMIYAKMDVNGYLYLTPAHDSMIPCFLVTPKRLIAGKTITFDLTYKFFTKSDELDYAEVCRWYSENCYSSNRLSKGIVAIPKDLKPRVLNTEGNEASGPAIPVSDHPEYIEWAKKAKITHLWDGWYEWDEIPTLDKSWVNAWGQKQTEQSAREEVKIRHENGFNCYSYRRQLFSEYAYRDSKPWKKSWMLSTKPDTVFVCPSGPEPIDNLPAGDAIPLGVEKHLRDKLGIEVRNPGRSSYIHADFCNDECRNFYIDALEKWFDKYNELDGFAFDMGWDIHTVPCLAHPDDGTHHGIVNLMANIYKYLEKNHPTKRVVMNMLQGSPSNLWCHAVMFEGGTDLSYEAIESVKIYRATMFSHYYTWAHKSIYGDGWLKRLEYNLLSNLAMGVVIGMGDVDTFRENPDLNNKLDLYALSAKLSCVPLVIETGAFLVDGYSRHDVYRSVFSNGKDCHAVIFNNNDAQKHIKARIRADYLKSYGWNGTPLPKKIAQFDPRGYLKASSDFVVTSSNGDIVIEGSLGPKELIGITSH